MRRLVTSSAVVALAVLGYAAADVVDLAPGILTRERPTPLPAPTAAGPAPIPVPLPSTGPPAPVLLALPGDAPTPAADRLAEVLDQALADPALGPSVGVSVRDARTGEELYGRGTGEHRIVASAQKILAAAAITSVLDPQARMTTAVRSPAPGELVLVAGGDTLLASGRSDPTVVAGRAGLADLAADVVANLPAGSPGALTLRLDMTYAAGPGYPDTPAYPVGWSAADLAAGYTQTISMIGLAQDRPTPGKPSPNDPGAAVLAAFARALASALPPDGPAITVQDSPALRATPAPAGAALLGAVESAAYGDVLALALDESDNALTENLARQASVRGGRDGAFADNADFVADTLGALGFDLSGTTLLDTSGLTRGQGSTARLLAQVTVAALDGTLPGLADVVAQLPVAGLDGTLIDRFRTGPASAAAGVARAKTGTLTGISSLVGTTVDADDRPLVFAIIADQVPPATGTLGARAALDRAVATLTACGCR